jgi:hypothetical protein
MRLNIGSRGKYGVVYVKKLDGTKDSEFRITAQELADLHKSQNGTPPGVTRRDWESGLACVFGKDMDTGDMMVDPDGALIVKYEEVDGVEKFMRLSREDYSGTPPNITIEETKLLDSDVERVVDGELTLRSR